MAQFMRPSSLVSSTGWTPVGAATLEEATDEVIPNDATDYAEVLGNGQAWQTKLSTALDPGVDTGHTLKLRVSGGNSGPPRRYRLDLYQGAGMIKHIGVIEFPAAYTWATHSYPLAAVDVAKITDYSDVRVVIISDNFNPTNKCWVTWIELQLPDPAIVAPVGGINPTLLEVMSPNI
ncbi:hypothetical protein ES703_50409 [subsurface metagenome]